MPDDDMFADDSCILSIIGALSRRERTVLMPFSLISFSRITNRIAIFAFYLTVSQATLTFGGMQAIKDKGAIRHLGVPYARFVSGSGDGFSTELIRGFANDLGLRYEYVETTWQSVISDLTGKTYRVDDGKVEVTGESPIKGDVIATGMTILSWREALFDFSIPTFPTGIWLVARSDSHLQPIRPGRTIAMDINAVKSLLNGVSVLYMPGTCLDPKLYQLEDTGATFIPLNLKMNEFAPAVINREAECTLIDVADSMIALEKWPGKLKIVGPVSEHQNIGCGFRKSDADLRECFNQYLQHIRSNGRYMQLVQRYYPGIEGSFPDFFDRYGVE